MPRFSRKNRELRIRCTVETYKAFRRFVVDRDFKDYEEALRYLLSKVGYWNPFID